MQKLRRPVITFVVVVLVVIGAGVGVLVATGTSQLSTVSCVPLESADVPVTSRWERVWTSGQVDLKPGMFVGLQVLVGTLIETPGIPDTFPWTSPTLSSDEVLEQTRECPGGTNVTTDMVEVYWYEAVATGRVSVTVPLTKAWLAGGKGEGTRAVVATAQGVGCGQIVVR